MNSEKESETPRTDAVFWKFHTHDDIVNLARDLERELAISLENQMKAVMEREKCCRDGNAISDLLFDTERRLAASKAEVARLNHQLLKTESDLLQSQDINSFLDTEFRIACKRAEKAEAEVERLKANLRRAIAIADVLRSGGSRACRELHHPKRDQHEYAEVCPVEERLEKASEELDGLKASLSSPSSL